MTSSDDDLTTKPSTSLDTVQSVDTKRFRWGIELLIVLGLSLGASAVYSVINIARTLSTTSLESASTTIVRSKDKLPVFDLIYQVADLSFKLVPVALVLYLLSQNTDKVLAFIGFDLSRPVFDLVTGVVLTLLIGLPGLGLYWLGRQLHITAQVVPERLDSYWWTVPLLIFAAVKNALVEEIIVVAYLSDRLARLNWHVWAIVLVGALLRGSYHLYQGFGPFIGNVVMGLVFGYFYARQLRVAPLVVAHTLLDVVAFVGYDAAQNVLPASLFD